VSASQFSLSDGNPGPVLTVTGELDLAVRDDLRAALAPLTGHVTVDLSAVTFVDSSAIGVIAGAHRRLTRAGGTLRLLNPQEMPRRAFEVVGLGAWIEDTKGDGVDDDDA
jgi:anti-sigma B factor antagonist